MTGLNNRAYFDRYLKSMDKKLLDDGIVYCMVEISNLIAINTEYSHQTGDEIIGMFAKLLKETFGKTDAVFVYNGNGSFIILVRNSDYIAVEDIINLFKLRLDEREEHAEIAIEYKVGIAESFRETRTARKLFTETIRNKKMYVSELKKEEEKNN